MAFIRKADTMGQSGAAHLNFVWKHDSRPIYMMDNHGAALWCWLSELEASDPYTLLHIDHHWDEGFFRQLDEFAATIPARPSLGDIMDGHDGTPQRTPWVLWDNYLHAMSALRPNCEQLLTIAHLDVREETCLRIPTSKIWRSSSAQDTFRRAKELRGCTSRVLINLDLDFFFMHCHDSRLRLAFTEEYIQDLILTLLDSAPDALWTIAWSPECCGGWEEAEHVAKLVDYIMDAGFPFHELTMERA